MGGLAAGPGARRRRRWPIQGWIQHSLTSAPARQLPLPGRRPVPPTEAGTAGVQRRCMQCPYCHVGQCKRHPLQDHGESTRASLGTGPMAQLRDQFRTELLARKRRQVAMEQMGEEAMNRGSEELEGLIRERERAKRRSDWPKDSKYAMGLRPVSDSDGSSDSSDSESASVRKRAKQERKKRKKKERSKEKRSRDASSGKAKKKRSKKREKEPSRSRRRRGDDGSEGSGDGSEERGEGRGRRKRERRREGDEGASAGKRSRSGRS